MTDLLIKVVWLGVRMIEIMKRSQFFRDNEKMWTTRFESYMLLS